VKPCAHCNKLTGNPRFCSRICSSAWWSKQTKPDDWKVKACVTCGIELQPARQHAKSKRLFCSRRCYQINRQSKSRITQTCTYCGKEFQRKKSQKVGARPFCSIQCIGLAKRVEKQCPGCGAKVIGAAKKYCSLRCYRTRRLKERFCKRCGAPIQRTQRFKVFRGKLYCSRQCLWDAKTVVRHCQTCGIELKQRNKKKAKKFCSKKCLFASFRKHYKSCLNCHEPMPGSFKRPIAANRRFCSIGCSRAYQGETTIEKTVRIWLEEQKIAFQQFKQFGRYEVDFYLPEYHVGIEADGVYWHEIKKKPHRIIARRQKFLDSIGLILIRLPEESIKDLSFIVRLKAFIGGRSLSLFNSPYAGAFK